MSLNIKNPAVERLLDEVVRLMGESKTEAIRKARAERCQRLALEVMTPRSEARLLAFLEEEMWSQVPADVLGTRLTKPARRRWPRRPSYSQPG